MPALPYSLKNDCRDRYTQNGNAGLISFGFNILKVKRKVLKDSDAYFLEMKEQEEKLLTLFEGSKSKLKRYLKNPHVKDKQVSVDIMRTVALLAASGVYGNDHMNVNEAARYLATIEDGTLALNGATFLEMRRKILCMAVDQILLLHESNPFSREPMIELDSDIYEEVLGGRASLSHLKHQGDSLEVRQQRRKRHDHTPKKAFSESQISTRVRALKAWTPKELNHELDRRGYVGQQEVRKRVCVAISNHISKIKSVYCDGVPLNMVEPAHPILVTGQSGSGKTYLWKLLSEIVQLPFASVDLTQYSEVGYRGSNIDQIPLLLMDAASGNKDLAQISICCLDECDKILQPYGHELISRMGTQRGLLKLLESGVYQIPSSDRDASSKASDSSFNTYLTQFVGLGVFPQLASTDRSKASIGFHADPLTIATDYVNGSRAEEMGMMTEILGRFMGGVLITEPLGVAELEVILRNTVARQYATRLARDDFNLYISDDVYSRLAEDAKALGTNARGIESVLCELVASAEYELRSDSSANTISISLHDGKAKWAIESRLPDDLFKTEHKLSG